MNQGSNQIKDQREEIKVDSDPQALEVDMNMWELCKENIQPIPQGRKVDILLKALPLIDDNMKRRQISEARKEEFEKDLEANCDDPNKQLDLWLDYVDWLEQNVPDGGKVNGLTNALEKCIEFYHDKREFKQDRRLFNIFMKFKRFCDEPIEVYGFMYANSICTLLARFYLNWSWQYEIKKNVKRAEELIKLGLRNLASPREVLIEAESELKYRIARMIRAGELDDTLNQESDEIPGRNMELQLAGGDIRAALQTLKFRVSKKKGVRVGVKRTGIAVKQANVGGLKSQTKLVNGIRVAKVSLQSSRASSSQTSIEVFKDDDQDENSVPDPLAHLVQKVPTSQRIQMVGRRGLENRAPLAGTLALRKVPEADENSPLS